jgi:hypothetical protein
MSSKTVIENTFCTRGETVCASELGKLSSDPAITKHPNPKFHVRFRDPDELGQEETAEFVASPVAHNRRTAAIPTGWLLRRSPKE